MAVDSGRRRRVLIVDDEPNQRSAVSRMVERWGFVVETAADGQEALDKLPAFGPHAIVTDVMMPGMDGMELLTRLNEMAGAPPVIVLTAFGSIDAALTTVHEHGAFWFVEKPIRPRTFRILLDRAVAHRRLSEDKERLERQLSSRGVLGKLIGSSAAMQEVFFLIRQAAPTNANILITGESGTGKEVVARLIHELSPRSGGPFVAMNCAALPETLIESELFGHEKGAFTGAIAARQGCFELSHTGTLLLDEIGDMPLALQSKLLRVLEDGRVRRLGAAREIQLDVRLLASTNRDPRQMVKEGKFREDLFYRLSVISVVLPPLRDRSEDIPALAEAILADLNQKHHTRITSLDPAVVQALERHAWPGNVRELRNVLERAVVLAGEGEIRLDQLPQSLTGTVSEPARRTLGTIPSVTFNVGVTLEQAEREVIEITLAHTRNNRTRAAEILGINQKTLYNKLKEYGEEPDDLMSFKAKILLLTGVLMQGLVGGLSALMLNNLVKADLENSLRLAELAAQQTKGLLLIRLEESWKTGASDRRRWSSAIATDARLPTFLESELAQAPSLLEISIAGENDRILVSSTRSSAGSLLQEHPSLRALLALGPIDRLQRVFARGPDYELRIPIGLLDDPRPIFTIQVLVSTVLLRDSLRPGVQWIGAASLTALLASLLFVSLLGGFISRNLSRIAEGIELIRLGEAVPALSTHSDSPEFAAVQSKLSLLGEEVRDTARTAIDFRSRVNTVLESLEEGILLFDSEHRLILSGGASQRLLRRPVDGLEVSTTSLGAILREASEAGRSVPERLIDWPGNGDSVPLLAGLDYFADGRALIRLRDPEGRREIESQLGLLSRLDAINRLTGGVAHEIKNPLNSIAARLALLDSMVGQDSDEAAEEIKVIGEEVERLDRVVRTFLDFTRPVEMTQKDVDIAEIARDVSESVGPDAARRGVYVQFSAVPEGVAVWGDPELLREALMNLAVNALDAMPHGGLLSFEVALRGRDAWLCVADTGTGIPEKVRDKIFQLYFTTKGNGSGVGLAMVYRAVQLHGGKIEVESGPGRGTRFFVTLPALLKP